MQFFHNPRCRKSREALQLLEEKGAEIEIIEYLKDVPSIDELKAIVTKLGIEANQLIRKNELVFKEQFKGKELNDAEWIVIMHEHPKLIERPILISGDKAIIGRPPEEVLKLL